jgi:hypothetical protein
LGKDHKRLECQVLAWPGSAKGIVEKVVFGVQKLVGAKRNPADKLVHSILDLTR